MALCLNPYFTAGIPVPCNGCDVCRLRRKRLWADRIMLESYSHGDSSFVTLTYSDDHLPEGGTLVPDDVMSWVKRLRARLSETKRKIRYFIAGEYGDESWRPHYHAAMFGLSELDTPLVQDTWMKGFCTVSQLTPERAAYTAGYVTKKMTKKEDVRLVGRHPEFTRMSLKPGIGALAMQDFARALENDHGLDWVAQNGDVPAIFKESLKNRSLGRYLRSKLREALGFGEKTTPKEKLHAFQKEMRELLLGDAKFASSSDLPLQIRVQNYLLDRDCQKLRNVQARAKIFASRKEI